LLTICIINIEPINLYLRLPICFQEPKVRGHSKWIKWLFLNHVMSIWGSFRVFTGLARLRTFLLILMSLGCYISFRISCENGFVYDENWDLKLVCWVRSEIHVFCDCDVNIVMWREMCAEQDDELETLYVFYSSATVVNKYWKL